jgi:predicted transposase YdaD
LFTNRLYSRQCKNNSYQIILENSLKYLRDLGNVIDTAKREGEQIAKKKAIIQALKIGLLAVEQIAEIFEVTIEEVLTIQSGIKS